MKVRSVIIKFMATLAILMIALMGMPSAPAYAATIISTASGGTWNVATTWVGGVVPAPTDNVTIATTGTGAVNISAAVAQTGSVTVNDGANLTTSGGTISFGGLTINSGGKVTMRRAFTVTGTTNISGTINFGSTNTTAKAMAFNGDVTLNSGAVWDETNGGANTLLDTFTFNGSLINNATTFTALAGLHTFSAAGTLSGATTTVIPKVTFKTAAYTNSGTLTVPTTLTITGVTLTNNSTITATTSLAGSGALTNGATGTLNINGASTLTTITNGGTVNINGTGTVKALTNSATGTLNIGSTSTFTTLTATAAGNTVNYTGAAQTVKATTYDTLIFSGTGAKTMASSSIKVNNNLSIVSGVQANIGAGLGPTVKTLTLGGTQEALGSWGSTSSSAYYKNNTYFAATTGIIYVGTPGLTITANSTSKIYGTGVNFAGTEFSTSALVAGGSVTKVTLNSTGASGAATVAGSPYPIVPSAAVGTGLTHYVITYVNGSLTVNPEPLTITANSLSKNYGDTVSFAGTEFTAPGLVNSDTVTSVTLNSTGADGSATVAGSPYPIVPSAAVGTGLANYTISYANGALTVNPASQSINFDAIPDETYGNPPFDVSATATSGLPVSFASTTTDVCAVSGSTVSILSAGTCTIEASQAGDSNYSAAQPVDQSFGNGKAGEAINFSALPDKTYGDADFDVSSYASATSGLAVSFSSETPSVCSVSGSTVSLASAGTCTIRASQSGNNNYNAASNVDQSFTVNPATQSIRFDLGTLPAKTYGDPDFDISSFASATSGLPVSFSSTTTSVCSVSDSTVSLTSAGTCTIRASQSGNSNYNAASNVDQSFIVNKVDASINVTPYNLTYDGASHTATAAATGVKSEDLSADLTLSGTAHTAAGAYTADAWSFHDPAGNYSDASGSVSDTIAPATPAITFGIAPTPTYLGGDFTVSASTTNTDNSTLTYSWVSGPCALVSGATFSSSGSGTCVAQASAMATANFTAALQQQIISIAKADQSTLMVTGPSNITYGVGGTVTTSGGDGMGMLSYDAGSSTGCSVDSSTGVITVTDASGNCSITAMKAADDNYSSATSAALDVSLNKANQTISFTSSPAGEYVGGPTYSPTANSTSGLSVTLTIDDSATSVCSINNNGVVSFAGAGRCIVDADQAGNDNYNVAAEAQQAFIVTSRTTPTLMVTNSPVTYSSLQETANVSGSVPGTISNVQYNGSSIVPTNSGTYSITADFLPDDTTNYNSLIGASAGDFVINKASQSLTFTSSSPSNAEPGGATYTPTANGGDSNNPVVFTIDAAAASVCSINDSGVVSFGGTGTCIVDANQAGNDNYTAAPQVQQTFPVGKANQTISFTSNAPTNAVIGGPTYSLSTTASSGLPVSLTIDASASSVCSISGHEVSFIGAGTCLIDANQAGNDNYTAAPQAQQSFTVSNPPSSISLSNASISEGQPSGTVIGTLSTLSGVSPYVYSITGGSDAASFKISANTLESSIVLAQPGSLQVTITVVDANEAATSANFTINVVPTSTAVLLSPADSSILNNDAPTFDWTDVTGAAAYQLQISNSSKFTSVIKSATVTPSNYTTTSNLPANVTLYWRVRVEIGKVWGTWSTPCSFMTITQPIGPKLVSPANNGLTSNYTPALTWKAAKAPAGRTIVNYEVQVATDSAFHSLVVDVNPTGLSYTLTSPLESNTKYYWRVRAYDSAGKYSPSAVWTFRTAMLAPTMDSPTGSTGSLKPTFTWETVSGATSYTIQVSRNTAFTKLVRTSTVKTSSYMVASNLPAGTLYWRVKANGANPSSWSTYFTITITAQ
ncbi:MAG TPA: MBG domain-containing protein [Anaerolineales bacterium]|nr:MBG domain-containing protein [Anaerolineales bacterium]